MDKSDQKETEEPMGCCSVNDSRSGCPMATMFKETIGGPKFGFLILIPSMVFVLGGVLVLIIPGILIWLLAGTSIVLGLAMFAIAMFLRRLSSRIQGHQT